MNTCRVPKLKKQTINLSTDVQTLIIEKGKVDFLNRWVIFLKIFSPKKYKSSMELKEASM